MKTSFQELSDQVVKRLIELTEDDLGGAYQVVGDNAEFLQTTFLNALSADDAVEYCAQTLNTLYY